MARKDGPIKDFAASHGMSHGGFKDFLKEHGEAKTSEQRATERAVAEARAAVYAREKTAGLNLEGSSLDKELAAQAARARALAHLDKHSCGPSQFELSGGNTSGRAAIAGERDNTLAAVRARDAAAKRKTKEERAAEKATAEMHKRMLAQNEALQGTGSSGAAASDESQSSIGELPQWWKEVQDPASGRPYYYNELTNETSWERPSCAVHQETN